MILGYLNRKWTNRAIVDDLYGQLTEMARQPVYYAEMRVPDTVMGRFEMLSILMVLFFRGAKAAGPSVEALSQDMVDTFFLDIDHSIRELGVGDIGVPKRMKKLARMFYGRAQSYGEALDRKDVSALADALGRNIHPTAVAAGKDGDAAPAADMTTLATAVLELDRRFAGLTASDLLAGFLGPVRDGALGAHSAG